MKKNKRSKKREKFAVKKVRTIENELKCSQVRAGKLAEEAGCAMQARPAEQARQARQA